MMQTKPIRDRNPKQYKTINITMITSPKQPTLQMSKSKKPPSQISPRLRGERGKKRKT